MAGTVPTHLTSLRLRFGMVGFLGLQAPLASKPRGLRESEAVPVFSYALLLVAGRSPVWIRLAFA